MLAQMRDHCPGDRNRADKIRVDLAFDLCVSNLLGGAEQGIAGIADDDVDPLEFGKGFADDVTDSGTVCYIKDADPKTLAVFGGEVVQSVGLANSGGDAISAFEQKLR
ncbi:uncharacterized protein YuzB (UPF0349 family) [Bradyrhizobium sp. RT9b]